MIAGPGVIGICGQPLEQRHWLARNTFGFENTTHGPRLSVCGLSTASINCTHYLPTQFLCILFPFSDAQQRCYTASSNLTNGFDPQVHSPSPRNG